jgi:hypothetical protein
VASLNQLVILASFRGKAVLLAIRLRRRRSIECHRQDHMACALAITGITLKSIKLQRLLANAEQYAALVAAVDKEPPVLRVNNRR